MTRKDNHPDATFHQERQDTIDTRWGKPSPLHDPYALANFTPRPTDVLITTAPKAGTTWMQQILHQLRSGGDENFRSIYDVVPWLEFPQEGRSWEQVLEDYEKIPDPRIFKTHCTWSQTPGTDVAMIILTSRDPRDCCVSFYHHVMDLTDEARRQTGIKQPQSFDEFFDRWMDFAAWFRNVQSWWPHFHDDNVLWLRYEDLKLDLGSGINQILDFLGWQVTPEQMPGILEYCSFNWMKNHAERFTRHSASAEPAFRPGGFIRKGQSGDYKNLLQQRHVDRIMAKATEMLEPACLDYLDLK
jgi:hypothetical protein